MDLNLENVTGNVITGNWCMGGIYVKTRKDIHGINLLLLLFFIYFCVLLIYGKVKQKNN